MRTYVISFASILAAQEIIGGIEYGNILGSTFVLFILALSLAQFFLFPILKLLALPLKGLAGIFLRTIIIGLIFYMSTSALNGFAITSTFLPEVQIFDISFPSKNLSPIETLLALSLTYSIINSLLNWLCKGKK